ncbi:hypothetical protein J2792_004049 [Novosphingobium capsulatum]|uniref:Uncharacterized protein n=1 Tax=Novosphingobium capsulatum TaxID=13688 RepID=A0ABU1MS53_9SPHN|nr:hypothetical protein [Novosphingobium capsulatum]
MAAIAGPASADTIYESNRIIWESNTAMALADARDWWVILPGFMVATLSAPITPKPVAI